MFRWSSQGRNKNSEELLTMNVITNESNMSKQLREYWNLENLGIETQNAEEEIPVDEGNLKQNTSYLPNRDDKATSRLRIEYDALSHEKG
ncbi:hypothetical protein NPIL_604411 [Nephila pilipes]|uniref:Uncharacterized protein n=1 Tax=Nephila pilipes TaxID=299642 RepID=A0A8X6MUH3_NEPPI|nr:hypothetical protein NPIL_604411 [Nephila pilipes]